MPDRLILALDTAGDSCSVALGRESDAGLGILAADKIEMKHGHATSPREWPHSSFHRFVRDGLLSEDWAFASNLNVRE